MATQKQHCDYSLARQGEVEKLVRSLRGSARREAKRGSVVAGVDDANGVGDDEAPRGKVGAAGLASDGHLQDGLREYRQLPALATN